MEDLIIGSISNGQAQYIDALALGVRMGDGFLNSLLSPPALKDFISSESRLKDGKMIYVDDVPKLASRELTLTFTVLGENHDDFNSKLAKFYDILRLGWVYIKIPQENDNIYKLVYSGTSSTFAYNRRRNFCKVSVKFSEPNPNDRK